MGRLAKASLFGVWILIACHREGGPPARASATIAEEPSGVPWWRHAVMYEIYPRSFQDSNGDGIGDLNGITQRLDYLADLGVDALWITPFFPSPQVDFGYDVSDYKNVDPQFGTLADFDRLVAEAHRRNIRIIADFVLNHTSDQHALFTASRSSRESPYRDFYIWRDGRDGGPPNNWSSVFGPVAWTLDPKTGQYYYHAFYEAQPDLNWRNPAVEKEMFDTVRFWLNRGVDGFRLDAVPHLFEDPQLRDNPVLPELRPGSTTEHQQISRYNRDLPEVHDAMRKLRKVTDEFASRVLIGEAYEPTLEEIAAYYGPHDDEVQLPFNFFFMQVKKLDASAFRKVVEDSERVLGKRWTNYVLSNHDNPRAFDRLGDGSHDEAIAKVLGAMLLTLRGTPFLYYGEEIGMRTTEPKTIDEVKDPVGRRYWPADKGRDGERTPMQWTSDPGGGFTTGTPWLKLAPDAATKNVAKQMADDDSILSFYRKLTRLRRSTPALLDGAYTSVPSSPQVFAYRRALSGQSMLIALNFSDKPQQLELEHAKSRQIRLSTVHGRSGEVAEAKVDLAPFEAIVLEEPTR